MLNTDPDRKKEYDIIPESKVLIPYIQRDNRYDAASDKWEPIGDRMFYSNQELQILELGIEQKNVSSSAVNKGAGHFFYEIASDFLQGKGEEPSGFITSKSPNVAIVKNNDDGTAMTWAPILLCSAQELWRIIKENKLEPKWDKVQYGEKVKNYRIDILDILEPWLNMIPTNRTREMCDKIDKKNSEEQRNERLKELHRNKKNKKK